MKNRLEGFTIGLGAFFAIFLCCGASYLLTSVIWNSLGTVVQQWIIGVLTILVGYHVIGIVFSVIVIVGFVVLAVWASGK